MDQKISSPLIGLNSKPNPREPSEAQMLLNILKQTGVLTPKTPKTPKKTEINNSDNISYDQEIKDYLNKLETSLLALQNLSHQMSNLGQGIKNIQNSQTKSEAWYLKFTNPNQALKLGKNIHNNWVRINSQFLSIKEQESNLNQQRKNILSLLKTAVKTNKAPHQKNQDNLVDILNLLENLGETYNTYIDQCLNSCYQILFKTQRLGKIWVEKFRCEVTLKILRRKKLYEITSKLSLLFSGIIVPISFFLPKKEDHISLILGTSGLLTLLAACLYTLGKNIPNQKLLKRLEKYKRS